MTSTPSSPPYIVDGKTDAERYFEGCLDGTYVVCRHVKRLAEIMLPRFKEGYKIYHYDVEAALRPVRFIEQFCRIPSANKIGQPFILAPYERVVIETAFGFVDDDGVRQHREVLVEWARKCGKALSLDTEIPTPGGWKFMRDIHPSDYVFGQDGKPSKVLVESEIFDKPTYLVTFEDGSTLKATDDHIWTVWDTLAGFDAGWHDVTTGDMADEFASRRYLVPLCNPVEYADVIHSKSLYVMGAEWVAYDMGCAVPDPNEIGSASQRIEFLSGMVSASMHFHATEDNNVSTCGQDVAESVASLCASLGYMAWVVERDGRYLCCFDDELPFKAIESIEQIPNEPSKCIAIDNPSHLYLAGRQYTATHNTSLLAALNLYMLTSDPDSKGVECYNGASSSAQASLCYGATVNMVEMSPLLAKRIRRGKVHKRDVTGLNYDKKHNFLCTISGNSKHLDGLSTFFAVLDELGVCEDGGAVYDLVTESTSSNRSPMIVIISTENYVRNNIWDERKNYAYGWLDGTIQDDRFIPFLYEMDSREEIYDEAMWPKASPGLGITKEWQYIRDRLNKAKQSPARMPSVLTKDFNLPSNSYYSFLSREECISSTDTFEFDPVTDRYGCLGFDLASKNDLCSASLLYMRKGDDRIYERSMSWISEDKIRINSSLDFKESDGVPYRVWESEGWLRIVPGDKVDQRVIIDWIEELAAEGMYVRWVGYDKWHVDDWTKRELDLLVGAENCEPIPQMPKDLSPAMKEHRIDLRAKRIVHNNNPVLVWARSNVQSKPPDANNNYFPQKRDLKPNKKIDPYISELLGYIELKKHWPEYLQLIGWYPPDGS